MPAALYVLAAVAVASTAVSVDQQQKTRKQEEENADLERAIGNEKAAKERRKSAAQAQVAQAQVENQAAIGGLTTSSAALTASADIQGQNIENIASVNEAQQNEQSRAEGRQKIIDIGSDGLGITLLKQAGTYASQGLGVAAGNAASG